MTPDWKRDGCELYCGDSLAVMKELPDNHVETIITDPPAGIGFMGKSWDSDKGGRDKWIAWLAERLQEGLRVTKPGGALLCWALPRTSHWTGFAVEDAGWGIFDRVSHLFGSGFPKSTDLSKKLDKAAGAERSVVGEYTMPIDSTAPRKRPSQGMGYGSDLEASVGRSITAPATPAAALWDGWGTALKPACEDWWFAHKPMTGATSDELYALTGWDWWHSDHAITNTPANRLKAYKRYGVRLPSGHYEVELCSIRRKALRAAVESDLLFCQRATVPARRKPPCSLVARVDVKAYRKWTACNGAANALEHGVAGLWIDGGRIGTAEDLTRDCIGLASAKNEGWKRPWHDNAEKRKWGSTSGRWPANVILQHCILPVCELAGTIPVDIEQQIRRYFDGYDQMQGLRESRGSASLAKEAGAKVLHPRMCEQGEEGTAENQVSKADVSELRQDIRVYPVVGKGGEAEVLQPEVPAPRSKQENQRRNSPDVRAQTHGGISSQDVAIHDCPGTNGEEASLLEGRKVDDQRGLRRDHSNGPDAQAIGNSPADATSRRHRDGASISDGDAFGQATETAGASPSCQRGKKRQPTSELRAISDCGTFTETPGSRSGTEQSPRGNPPLEVLACDIPQEWLGYFVETGEDLGCVQRGVKRVKGDGHYPASRGKGGLGTSGHGGQDALAESNMTEETVEDWDCVESCPVRLLGEQSGECSSWMAKSNYALPTKNQIYGQAGPRPVGPQNQYGDTGTAARFFYCAKASKRERTANGQVVNSHPTVKPLALMCYLARLTKTPTGGTVLDPFMGSGTTALACIAEGRRFIGIEKDRDSFNTAVARIEAALAGQAELLPGF